MGVGRAVPSLAASGSVRTFVFGILLGQVAFLIEELQKPPADDSQGAPNRSIPGNTKPFLTGLLWRKALL